MKSSLFLGIVVCACFVHETVAKYPSTYPFMEESSENHMPILPDATPNFKMDDSDPGGYCKKGFAELDMDECEWPWTMACFFGWDHFLYTNWEIVASPAAGETIGAYVLPDSHWNCTGREETIFFEAAHFPGDDVGSLSLTCEKTQCCEPWIGHFSEGGVDGALQKHEEMSSLFSASGCPSELPEEIYCGAGDVTPMVCMEFYVSKTERAIVRPCPDVLARYYASCTLFQAAGMVDDAEVTKLEPEAYVNGISKEDSFYMKSLLNSFDRVCYPYSYYNGGDAGGDDSGATAAAIFTGMMVVSTFMN